MRVLEQARKYNTKVIYNKPDNFAFVIILTDRIQNAEIKVYPDGKALLNAKSFTMLYENTAGLIRDWTILERRVLIEKNGYVL
jgi:hypothetical protein